MQLLLLMLLPLVVIVVVVVVAVVAGGQATGNLEGTVGGGQEAGVGGFVVVAPVAEVEEVELARLGVLL
jgi:hypothetical protein